ncbi:DUF262 domain-containing protein [Actinopolymorpha sp. NPDC004070]|uniref:DUF262 domain-containing protein n=1 Tax=Actinopolymorpha sp. NPDC004070 TaxID=3154548 RepID=UPI0033A33A77
MRFNTSDPDLDTIVNRVRRKTIDLQPEFQRGEVWTISKKQRLIDSILRRWHVPPIHLVAKGGGRFDVLDGQQRLTAIRDFMDGIFPVDGRIEPQEDRLYELHGKKYSQLPEEVRDEFGTFSIRVFELGDYSPDEPHELFFRLNQPTNLTEAEKRNAFIGDPRNQVRELVDWASAEGLSTHRIGFSNARMAYDDLIARFMLTLEQRSLVEKVTAQRITNRYRTKSPFSPETIATAKNCLSYVLQLPMLDGQSERIKPNKATVHTWLCMAARANRIHKLEVLSPILSFSIEWIERARMARDSSHPLELSVPLRIFQDRATARVADVSSVVLRDLTAWMIFADLCPERLISELPMASLLLEARAHSEARDAEHRLSAFSQKSEWGAEGWI